VREPTVSKLNDIVRAVLELPSGADVTTARQAVTPAWDSLAHAVLIGAVESEFGLQVDAADSLDLTSYEAIAQYLEAQGR
jgi:acyl carrier protein